MLWTLKSNKHRMEVVKEKHVTLIYNNWIIITDEMPEFGLIQIIIYLFYLIPRIQCFSFHITWISSSNLIVMTNNEYYLFYT